MPCEVATHYNEGDPLTKILLGALISLGPALLRKRVSHVSTVSCFCVISHRGCLYENRKIMTIEPQVKIVNVLFVLYRKSYWCYFQTAHFQDTKNFNSVWLCKVTFKLFVLHSLNFQSWLLKYVERWKHSAAADLLYKSMHDVSVEVSSSVGGVGHSANISLRIRVLFYVLICFTLDNPEAVN